MNSSKKLCQLRLKAYRKQKHQCFYCELPMWTENPTQFAESHKLSARQANELRCTAEHLLARRDGGKDTSQNIVAACTWCNRK